MKKFFKIDKVKIKKFCVDFFFLVVACCIGAYSLTAVLIPNGLTSGGVTGIVRIIQNYVAVDFSILYYGGVLILLVGVTIIMGLKEGQKILLMTFLFPAIVFVFERFDLSLLEEKDIILAAIFCGVFFGISSGIVFWRGYAFCGTDAIAKVLKKKCFPNIALSQILLVIDAVIIICSAFVYGRNIALYALVTQVIFAKTVDYILYGFETKIVQLEIITAHTEEVTDYIMHEIGRGVSEIDITGAYTKTEYRKLMTLCSPRESMLIKKFIAGIDKKAFVSVIQVNSVWGRGEGFNDIDVD